MFYTLGLEIMGHTVTELFNLENNYIITESACLASKGAYKVSITN
jgi:hypothetical protein